MIDPGEARISRYSVRSRLQRPPIEPISQQRQSAQGRCGVSVDGVCFRLYSEQDFWSSNSPTRRSAAPISRPSCFACSSWVWGRGSPSTTLTRRLCATGTDAEELCGIGTGTLTALGQRMARLPVDPRLGRMLLAAKELGCLAEMLVIVSAMSIQDPASDHRQTGPGRSGARALSASALGFSGVARAVALLRGAAAGAESEPATQALPASTLLYTDARVA